MPRHAVPKGSLIIGITGLSVAPVLALAALVAFGRLDVGSALAAAMVCVAVIGWMVRRHLVDVAALAAYAEELVREGDAVAPKLSRPSLMPEFGPTIARLRQLWSRQRAELERIASSSESVLENLPQPLILLDDQRRVVRATIGARDLLGSDVAGRDLSALLRNPEILEAADRVIARGGSEDVEFALHFPIEHAFSARIVRLPAPAADGTTVALALYELTAIKRAEQTRVDFVANASHELRTPLSVLVGCIKTLRGTARDDREAQDRFLAMMEGQADRMSRLVDDLLSLSRIELNEHTPPTDAIDLRRLIGQVADTLEFPANARGMRVEIETMLDVPPVAGDADQLTQLFQNLIDNAIKYSREDSTVRILVSRAEGDAPASMPAGDGVVSAAIQDQGEGIAPDHLPRLTERFYRVDTARSRELGGTGLGLAIVKHILNRHRGALNVDSTVGEGTTFTVYLPAAGREARDQLAAAATEAELPFDRRDQTV